MLADVVEEYMPLTGDEQEEFARIASANEEVTQMLSTYVSTYERRGIEKGRAESEVRVRQQTLLRQMTRRFGPLPEAVRTAVDRIADAAELDRLLDRLIDGSTLEEMELRVD